MRYESNSEIILFGGHFRIYFHQFFEIFLVQDLISSFYDCEHDFSYSSSRKLVVLICTCILREGYVCLLVTCRCFSWTANVEVIGSVRSCNNTQKKFNRVCYPLSRTNYSVASFINDNHHEPRSSSIEVIADCNWSGGKLKVKPDLSPWLLEKDLNSSCTAPSSLMTTFHVSILTSLLIIFISSKIINLTIISTAHHYLWQSDHSPYIRMGEASSRQVETIISQVRSCQWWPIPPYQNRRQRFWSHEHSQKRWKDSVRNLI